MGKEFSQIYTKEGAKVRWDYGIDYVELTMWN